MRGRSSSAKSRLRSAGYKCNLCGRRLIDAATLERHRKTIHNVTHRENKTSFKSKPSVQRSKLVNKERVKVFDHLVKQEAVAEAKPKRRSSKNNNEHRDTFISEVADEETAKNKDIEHVENGKSLLIEKEKKSSKKEKDGTRRVEFECPVCAKSFSVYFTAHKHIQKAHSIDANGQKVAPNSPDLVQPIRVEHCYRCQSKMRSNEPHICFQVAEDPVNLVAEFVCSGCNQMFVSLKTFDMHVAGLHSDAVDSMFFPTKIEFMNWRLEMERHTNAKYTLYGEYEAKKIYRCSYARKDDVNEKTTAYFCPSSMVVQEFSKGIQVHFYNKHYDHPANPYTLSGKYKKYSITSFLKHPTENNVSSRAYSMQLNDKELFLHFKKLMDSIVLNAADVDISVLKTLIEKALEMSAVVTDAAVSEAACVLKPGKNMSDTEITEALEVHTVLHKRRKSDDFYELKPAKRTRNTSLFSQDDVKMSPKILNTFSLASNSNSEEFKSDNAVDVDFGSIKSDSNDRVGPVLGANSPESDARARRVTKLNTRLTSFNESLSFNDSYKDFIDKNFIGKSERAKDGKLTKTTVKTKLGAFKQTSPRKSENRDDVAHNTPANNKKIGAMTPIATNVKVEEAPTTKVNTGNTDASKVNILSVETPNVTITKLNTTRSNKVTNSQINTDTTKVNTSRTNTRGAYTHLVDPLQVNISKVNRSDSSSPVESVRGNVSKVNTRSVTSPLVDPLELNITKVRTSNLSTPVMEPLQRNISKVNSRSVTSSDNLKFNTSKVNMSKLGSPKVASPKANTNTDSMKSNTPKLYSGRVTPKVNSPPVAISPRVTPKVSFEDSTPRTTPQKRIKELQYEVREQENDCNILVLKL